MALTRCPKIPRCFLYTFFILSLLKRLITWLLHTLGLGGLIDHESDQQELQVPSSPQLHELIQLEETQILSADLISKMLPVVKFEELNSNIVAHGGCTQESCAVCLCDFEGNDEIRPLMNCPHIFHRSCLDGWIDHDHNTCPLCRTPFIPVEVQEAFKQNFNSVSLSSIMM